MTTVTSGTGRRLATVHDDHGRTVEIRPAGQVPTRYVFDSLGFLTAVERTNGLRTRRVTMTYDARGYLAAATTSASSAETLSTLYPSNDAMGFPTETTVPTIGTLSLRPAIDGLVEGLTPPSQSEHTFRYDVLGRETAYAPAGTSLPPSDCAPGVSCTRYDRAGRVSAMQHEDGTSTAITYVPARGLVDHVDVPNDGRYQFGYDSVGRPTSIAAPDGGTVTYAWQASWPVRETYGGTHVVRDASTNAVVWSGGLGGAIDRTYSEFLELETVSVTGGYAVRLGRDVDGLVTSLAPVSGTSVPTLTLARSNLDGHVTSTTAGVVGTSVDLDIDAAAPGFGDLRGLSATRSTDGAVLYDADYEVDDAGRIVRWTETTNGATTDRRFAYDAASRLVGVRDAGTNAVLATYGYDGNGNRTRVLDVRAGAGAQDVELGRNLGCDDASGAALARAANPEDQLCRYGDFSYAYDANGRLATRTNTTTGATLRLRYDAAGRLHEAVGEDGTRVHYVNDALGRRIGRVVNGQLERGWIYGSELAPIAEVNAAGQVVQTYVYASRLNVPDLIVQEDGDVYRVVHDHLGSVRLVVDARTGVVVHRMRFDEWGVLVEESGASSLHPFGYAGGFLDRTTGLTRFGVRDYDPGTGRWTAKDPLAFAASDPNLYRYCGDSPIVFADPSGKIVPIVAAGLFVVASGLVSAGVSAFVQYQTHGGWDGIDWGDVAIAGGGGIAQAGVALTGVGFAGELLAGIVVGAGSSWLQTADDCLSRDQRIGEAFLAGGIGGVFAGASFPATSRLSGLAKQALDDLRNARSLADMWARGGVPSLINTGSLSRLSREYSRAAAIEIAGNSIIGNVSGFADYARSGL